MSNMQNLYHKVASAKPFLKGASKVARQFVDPIGIGAPRASKYQKQG